MNSIFSSPVFGGFVWFVMILGSCAACVCALDNLFVAVVLNFILLVTGGCLMIYCAVLGVQKELKK